MDISCRRLPVALLVAVGLAGAVVGCGPDDTSTKSSAPVVVVTETHTETVGPATTATTATTTPSPTATQADTAAYVGDWTGHTRGMALSSDGTGTMSVFSGAADGEDWTLTWGASGGGVDVTLVSRTSVVGDGLSGAMNAGATYRGTLTSDSAGVTYMTMTGFGNGGYPVTWCNRERYGSSPECGA
ncbi:hypothetical protein [Gordonia sp. NB41Y]|uniref:hypothetical protein n=1 Tax=Gordonia sp. NB41Y TaxID=875808 RepID=UPI000344DB46|nr:hypothetical protein [Gordonia sp. NB41Y]EMP13743.2 hypothetical protein ISGA_2197 [Gordonia sp. NB41Y]WLP92532.1 hypothetical protein Q9K23_10040 [Gordonia sp. NB41Y]